MELDSGLIKELMYYKDEYERLQRFIVYANFRLKKRDWDIVPELEYDDFRENPYLWDFGNEIKKIITELKDNSNTTNLQKELDRYKKLIQDLKNERKSGVLPYIMGDSRIYIRKSILDTFEI